MAPRKLPVVPQPTMAEVLYEPPFANGDRKVCANCGLYVATRDSSSSTCVIHGSVAVRWDAICGYHVPGEPMTEATARGVHVRPVLPALSGLERVIGGTSCDRCAHYQRRSDMDGTCVALHRAPVVAARGCCTRWVAAR
jgi:hypothetical protein